MYIKETQGWEIAQFVKSLPHKYEGLSLIPSTHLKMLGVIMPTCNLGPGGEETGGSLWLTGQPV